MPEIHNPCGTRSPAQPRVFLCGPSTLALLQDGALWGSAQRLELLPSPSPAACSWGRSVGAGRTEATTPALPERPLPHTGADVLPAVHTSGLHCQGSFATGDRGTLRKQLYFLVVPLGKEQTGLVRGAAVLGAAGTHPGPSSQGSMCWQKDWLCHRREQGLCVGQDSPPQAPLTPQGHPRSCPCHWWLPGSPQRGSAQTGHC